MKDISVIIPVRHDPEGVSACVAALARQKTLYTFEILVVDNNDRFCAADYEGLDSGDAPLRVLHEPRRSSYAARNRGIRAAQGRMCAFTDADCLPQPEWLEQGMNRIRQGAVLVGGAVSMMCRHAATPTFAERFDRAYYLDQHRYVTVYGFAATANLFAPRAIFGTVGLFDATLQSGGDKEWCLRAGRAGYRVVYEPYAIIRHPARDTFVKILRKAERIEAGYKEESGLSPWKGLLLHLSAVTRSLRQRAFSWTEIGGTLFLLFLLLCYLQCYKRLRPLTQVFQRQEILLYSEGGEA